MNASQNIPLFTDTSTDWHKEGIPSNYSVNLDVGINEYQFGRTTPNNKFVVSTGLVDKPYGIEMVGGSKKSKSKTGSKSKKPSSSLLNKIKKSFENIKALVGLKSSTKKMDITKSKKSKTTVKSKTYKKKKIVKKSTKAKTTKKKKVMKKM
jgi:hypothetical protein